MVPVLVLFNFFGGIMSATLIADVENNVREFWSDIFVPEFVEMSKLPSLISRKYDGEIKATGDSVRVSQITTPTATRRTIGTPGYEQYSAQKMQSSQIVITADTIIDAGYEFDSLVDLQSQIRDQKSTIRQGLLKALEIEFNNWIFSMLSPSASSPDHIQSSVTDFNDAQLLVARAIAANAFWPDGDTWLGLSSSYINDLLATTTMTSSDFVLDNPKMTGRFVAQRYGINIYEDNTVGSRQISPTGAATDLGLLFNPEFMYLVMAMQPTFKISDLHVVKRRGYLLTVELISGAKRGIDSGLKHATFYNS
jgi:hypothetical protein